MKLACFALGAALLCTTLSFGSWLFAATLEGVENSRARYHQEIGK